MDVFPRLHPVLLIDGTCAFCWRWADHLKRLTGIDIIPYQHRGDLLPNVSPEEFHHALKMIDQEGHVWSGAEAVVICLGQKKGLAWVPFLYKKSFSIRTAANAAYSMVSSIRRYL